MNWNKDSIFKFRLRLQIQSQQELATLIGASLSAVASWEQGAHVPDKRFRIALDNLCKLNNITNKDLGG